MNRLQSNYPDLVKYRSLFLQLLLFGSGCLLVFSVAPAGFLPSNQSIIFDGGWRIFSGQIPFKDYTAPNALLPSIFQAGCFGLFGVSWFAYILHSAVLNGLFCVVVCQILQHVGLSWKWSFFYAAASGVIFYPPAGLPYMEQHAFFFSLCALYIAVTLQKPTSDRSLFVRAAFLILLLCAAYLSKQIPTLIFVPLILCTAIISAWYKRKLVSIYLGSSIIAVLLLLVVIVSAFAIDVGKLYYYFFELPASMGSARFSTLLEKKSVQLFFAAYGSILSVIGVVVIAAGMMALSYRRYRHWFKVVILAAFTFLFALAAAVVWKSPIIVLIFFLAGYSIIRKSKQATLWPPILAALLLIGCLVFVAFTNMLPENGMPFAYLAAGLVHASIGGQRTRKVQTVLATVLIAATVLDASIFHMRINLSRAALFLTPQDFVDQPEARITKPAAMEWFRGPLYSGYRYNANTLAALANFLAAQRENFWLFGDASILYGITEKPSTNPVLWYHYNLTIPSPGSNEFISYQEEVLSNFKQFNVKWVVIEDTVTKTGCKLRDFSLINNYVDKNRIESMVHSTFQLIKLK